MANKIVKFPYMELVGKRWTARLLVPADVRLAFEGRKILKYSTGLHDPVAAYTSAKPVIDGWHQKIAQARKSGKSDADAAIEQARQAFAAMQASSPDRNPWEEVVAPLLARLGLTTPNSYDDQTGTDEQDAAPTSEREAAVISRVIGNAQGLGLNVDLWAESLTGKEQKTKDMYVSQVRQMVAAVGSGMLLDDPDTIAQAVQRWIDGLGSEGISPKTIALKLGACSSYWKWLVSHGYASRKDDSPFLGRQISKAKRQDPATKRRPFAPEQVMQLHHAALHRPGWTAQECQPLADLIMLAAYTGGRIEELASLEVQHVDLEADTVALSSKTDAGDRVIPIASAIKPLLSRLVSLAQDGVWLIHSAAGNKYGVRSSSLSKQFGRLKVAQGYGEQYVFHSIRKTVATLFETAECPEGIAADILGHEKPSMTYGLYSGGAPMPVKREWLLKAIKYPDTIKL